MQELTLMYGFNSSLWRRVYDSAIAVSLQHENDQSLCSEAWITVVA